MSEEQKSLKKARKTGPYKFLPNPAWASYWDHANIPPIVKQSWEAASKARDNKVRITAALNLYHELRGSPYRHNVQDSQKFQYDKIMSNLRMRQTISEQKL